MRSRFPRAFLAFPAVASMLATMMPQGTEAAVFRPLVQQGHVNYRAATAKAAVSCSSLSGLVLDADSKISSATESIARLSSQRSTRYTLRSTCRR